MTSIPISDDTSRIGMRLPDGLPNREYTLTDGTVSVILDQSGGINGIEYRGPRRHKARRGSFFSNGIFRGMDFFTRPVIAFELTDNGAAVTPLFRNLTLCPFAVVADSDVNGAPVQYRIWLRGCCVFMEWTTVCEKPRVLKLKLCEKFMDFLNEASAWDTPRFDAVRNAFRYSLLRLPLQAGAGADNHDEQQYEACALVGALDSSTVARRANGSAELSMELSRSHPATIVIAFGDDALHAESEFELAGRQHAAWFEGHVRKYSELASLVPVLQVPGCPDASEIVRLAPLFIRSLVREKNANEVAFRAGGRGYGMYNGWDGQFGSLAMNVCGENDIVRKHILFMTNFRGPNDAIPISCADDFGPVHGESHYHPPQDRALGAGWNVMHDAWFVENLHAAFLRTNDQALMDAAYPAMGRAMRTIRANAGPTGLVESCFGGADYGVQLNRPEFPDPRDTNTLSSRLSGVEDHALLFNACQLGAELACFMRDPETLSACVELSRLLEQNFMRHFFDEETGYLIDCVWPKDNPVNLNRTPRLTALMALGGYGELLSMNAWGRLADFVMRRLTHPEIGLREIPADQPVHPRGANYREKWLQNSTRDLLKLARLAERQDMMDMVLGRLTERFREERLIKENIYNANARPYFDPAKQYLAASWWQCMTSSLWFLGLLEAVAGIRIGRGRLEYIPGDSGHDACLDNLHDGAHCWAFDIRGRGRWIDTLTINGQAMHGTYQFTPIVGDFGQRVQIVKTSRPPATPILYSAGAAKIAVSKAAPDRLETRIQSPGFSRLWFYSPRRPSLRINGNECDYRWCGERNEGTAGIMADGEASLEITC